MRLDGLRNMILDEENQRNQVEVVLNGQDKKLRRVNELGKVYCFMSFIPIKVMTIFLINYRGKLQKYLFLYYLIYLKYNAL